MISSATPPGMCLRLEREAVEELTAVLEREQAVLIAADIEGVEALLHDKIRTVRRLTELSELRDQRLAAKGRGRDNLRAWIAEDPNVASAKIAWHELLDLARAAQRLNQTNGQLMAGRLQQARQALAVLQTAHGTPSLYGPNGQTLGMNGSRSAGRL